MTPQAFFEGVTFQSPNTNTILDAFRPDERGGSLFVPIMDGEDRMTVAFQHPIWREIMIRLVDLFQKLGDASVDDPSFRDFDDFYLNLRLFDLIDDPVLRNPVAVESLELFPQRFAGIGIRFEFFEGPSDFCLQERMKMPEKESRLGADPNGIPFHFPKTSSIVLPLPPRAK